MPDKDKEKDKEVPPGAPDRNPVKEPVKKVPMGDPGLERKKKRLKTD